MPRARQEGSKAALARARVRSSFCLSNPEKKKICSRILHSKMCLFLCHLADAKSLGVCGGRRGETKSQRPPPATWRTSASPSSSTPRCPGEAIVRYSPTTDAFWPRPSGGSSAHSGGARGSARGPHTTVRAAEAIRREPVR